MKNLVVWLCLPAILIQALIVKKVLEGVFYEKVELVSAVEKPVEKSQEETGVVAVEKTDDRPSKLVCFFNNYDSILADSSDTFVTSADKNGLDYRLLPAISFIESTACKNYLTETNNCWGWGHGRIVFDSIDDAIVHISERLAVSHYYREWQADKQDYWKLATVYNGGDQVKWHKDLVSTMKKIEECK